MKGEKILLCASLAVFTISNSACAYYNVINLGTLGGNYYSGACSVNNNGRIVGNADRDDSGVSYACFFDSAGDANNNIDLGTLSGVYSSACSINDKGQIVGRSNISSGFFDERACLFDPTGGGANKDLGTLGGNTSRALSINKDGWIVGSADNGSGYWRACLFDSTGDANKNIDLGTLGSSLSKAYSINDLGQIVGYAEGYAANPTHGRACLFDPKGNQLNIDLGTLGGDNSEAMSINNYGLIVGSADRGGLGGRHACLFDLSGDANNIDLGSLGDEDDLNYSIAYSINDSNQIVGYVEESPENWRACLFDPTGNGNNIDLNTLIDPSSGWILQVAYDINNDGWIVGQGAYNGQCRAFLLVIPEPGTIVLLAFGGLAVLSRNKNEMKKK